MKIFFLSFISLLIGFSCFGQEIEFYGLLNISSEQRFQGASGIGFQYQQDLSRKFKIGLGISYNFNHSQFDQIPYIDANPGLLVAQHIKSDARRFSVRLNVQGLLKDNLHISLTLGPEVSYNILWGQDNVQQRTSQSTNWNNYSHKISTVKDFGVGIISSMEVKNFIAQQLSLCFSIRPEILLGNMPKGETPVFSGNLLFTEFQIGLKYRFKK